MLWDLLRARAEALPVMRPQDEASTPAKRRVVRGIAQFSGELCSILCCRSGSGLRAFTRCPAGTPSEFCMPGKKILYRDLKPERSCEKTHCKQ